MSLEVVFDFDIYLEVAEVDLENTWKDYNIVDFWKFFGVLFNQMIKYNPTH